MHPSLFTVLMHVCVVSSPTASSGARRSEVHSAGSPDATHRLSVASVSRTSIRFAGRRETEKLHRSMDFSIWGHSVAPEHGEGYPTRFSGRSETAREPPLRLGSTTVASLSGARGMHRHSSALPGVGGRGEAPSRHRGRPRSWTCLGAILGRFGCSLEAPKTLQTLRLPTFRERSLFKR